jgi:toxin CcdB
MARYDVYRGAVDGYWLDCQADIFADLNSRFVVPLRPESETPAVTSRLNPVFVIEGQRYLMKTQFAAAVRLRELGPVITSLDEQGATIMAALDMLITGY